MRYSTNKNRHYTFDLNQKAEKSMLWAKACTCYIICLIEADVGLKLEQPLISKAVCSYNNIAKLHGFVMIQNLEKRWNWWRLQRKINCTRYKEVELTIFLASVHSFWVCKRKVLFIVFQVTSKLHQFPVSFTSLNWCFLLTRRQNSINLYFIYLQENA